MFKSKICFLHLMQETSSFTETNEGALKEFVWNDCFFFKLILWENASMSMPTPKSSAFVKSLPLGWKHCEGL